MNCLIYGEECTDECDLYPCKVLAAYQKGKNEAVKEFYNEIDRLIKSDSKQTYYYTEFCRFMMEVKEQMRRDQE